MSFPLPGSTVQPLDRVVVFEPNPRVRQYIEKALVQQYSLEIVEQETSLRKALTSSEPPQLTVLTWNATERSTSTLKYVMEASDGRPVLLLLAATDVKEVAFAMQLGPIQFLQMPFTSAELCHAVAIQIADAEQAVREAEARVNADLAPQAGETALGDGTSFVRSSKRMCDIQAQAALVAKSDIPLLILGESGTGKEILAKYTHLQSNRADHIFLKVNCAAMPADLLESELFGYEQGAFTGAVKSKPGKFEVCEGGTIFLDEIGEMPAALQAKLLHVLQDGTYSRLGSRATLRANVRVIAATNVDMKSAMANKTFRQDLYYRLNGFSLTLPPLRERREEIATFARYFMSKGSARYGRPPLQLSSNLLAVLTSYHWPGNLREMENVINRYLVIGDERAIIAELAPAFLATEAAELAADPATSNNLREIMRTVKGNAESAAIANILQETKWNRKQAASKMQISYKSLLYKIKQYELDPSEL